MIRICAWCQQEGHWEIPEQRSENSLGPVTHGICRYHAHRLRSTFNQIPLHQPNPASSHLSDPVFNQA